MPIVTLTREAVSIVRGAATRPFRETAVPRPDGLFDVPLGADTLEAIQARAFPGESLSDTVVRIILTAGRRAN
jgi:hypothetical protein